MLKRRSISDGTRVVLDREEAYEAILEALDSIASPTGVIQADPKTAAELCMEALGFGVGPYDE
jgi:hypothetical protein